MEARSALARRSELPTWLLGLLPLLLVGLVVGLFVTLGSPGIDHRTGPPVEELAVERVTLTPGEIALSVRNDGPDPVRVALATVNDAFVPLVGGDHEIGRLASARLVLREPWIEGQNYEIALISSTGATITHAVEAAAETPSADLGFFGLMALLGIYVGVIPIALGMFWLPWIRRIPATWLRAVLSFTVGLLAFLVVDATLEGFELAAEGAQVFGGAALVLLGGVVAYLLLSAVSVWLGDRQAGISAPGRAAGGLSLALLVALGIGLHNLGEGLAIGSAYAVGAISLGTFLVIGFALHNTTEGLAIVAPTAARPPGLSILVGLGLLAGLPAVLGAFIGAVAFNASVAAFLFGLGAGAIVQVIVQLAPSLRDRSGRLLNPLSVGGLLAGMAVLYLTGLLVTV